MAEFTVLSPKWDNNKIKTMFNICDEVLDNEDRFYYITSEGKLAYLETKATNKAATIAKVFYTLGMLDSDRTAKEQISCGIGCCRECRDALEDYLEEQGLLEVKDVDA